MTNSFLQSLSSLIIAIILILDCPYVNTTQLRISNFRSLSSLQYLEHQNQSFIAIISENIVRSRSLLSHFDWKLSLAGGMAGGISNGLLLPLDTLKTMRQSDKNMKSLRQAFNKLRTMGIGTIYSGLIPAVLGSIPSSALYFGSYETAKSILYSNNNLRISRPFIHMLAAIGGNIASSIVFVPKDVIKQQLQGFRTNSQVWSGNVLRNGINGIQTIDVIKHIFKTKGLKGFFPSYRATLMRNIPSAVIRFTIYEELKLLSTSENSEKPSYLSDLKYLVAGGIASMLSSIATTPIDVIKTRLATGVIPEGTPIWKALTEVARTEGLSGLYAGVNARILYSAAFGGVGFYCFEACKKVVGR